MRRVFFPLVSAFEIACSLLTLALLCRRNYKQRKWVQQNLRPCQQLRLREGPWQSVTGATTAESLIRRRIWVVFMIAFDVVAVILNWFYLSLLTMSRETSISLKSSMLQNDPDYSHWAGPIVISTLMQNVWTSVGLSVVGAISSREVRLGKVVPLPLVVLVFLVVSLFPPYVFVGIVLDDLLPPSKVVIILFVELLVAVIILCMTAVKIVGHVRRSTGNNWNFVLDIIVDIKEHNYRSSMKLLLGVNLLHLLLGFVVGLLALLDFLQARLLKPVQVGSTIYILIAVVSGIKCSLFLFHPLVMKCNRRLQA